MHWRLRSIVVGIGGTWPRRGGFDVLTDGGWIRVKRIMIRVKRIMPRIMIRLTRMDPAPRLNSFP